MISVIVQTIANVWYLSIANQMIQFYVRTCLVW